MIFIHTNVTLLSHLSISVFWKNIRVEFLTLNLHHLRTMFIKYTRIKLDFSEILFPKRRAMKIPFKRYRFVEQATEIICQITRSLVSF